MRSKFRHYDADGCGNYVAIEPVGDMVHFDMFRDHVPPEEREREISQILHTLEGIANRSPSYPTLQHAAEELWQSRIQGIRTHVTLSAEEAAKALGMVTELDLAPFKLEQLPLAHFMRKETRSIVDRLPALVDFVYGEYHSDKGGWVHQFASGDLTLCIDRREVRAKPIGSTSTEARTFVGKGWADRMVAYIETHIKGNTEGA